jgi:hypothetical protein
LRAAGAPPQIPAIHGPAQQSNTSLIRSACMTNRPDPGADSWLSLVLRDVQFWVPLIVLAAGLLVLRWIS